MRLKELRKKFQYTQQEIAGILGISRGAYANIENGKREPDIATIKQLAKLFYVSVDYLIGLTDNPCFSGGPLAAFIKERRGEESEESFAQRCGISVDLLRRIEEGFRNSDTGDRLHQITSLATEDMRKIAEALGVDWRYIAALYDGYNPHKVSGIEVIPKEDRTADFSDEILHSVKKGLSTQEQLLLYAYHAASPGDRAIFDNIAGRYSPRSIEDEARAEAESVYCQVLMEKQAEAESSASQNDTGSTSEKMA